MDLSTEDLYRRIVDEAQDAIIVADREGTIRLWNTSAETVFGYSAEEAVGRSLDLIIPERLRQRHWDGYTKVMETGETRYGRELLSVPGRQADQRRDDRRSASRTRRPAEILTRARRAAPAALSPAPSAR